MTAARPFTVLIAALGGEGGGVLTNWIVSAAESLNYPVQSTSIPGVAQRTGSTTYYIEIMPVPRDELGGREPVFALTPGIGDIDLFVASELLEANRAIAAGYITRGRTAVIASCHRHYVINEKIAMGDGRLDAARLEDTIAANARSVLLLDIDHLARQSKAMINSVMLGLIAGSGQAPIGEETFATAIRGEGKGVDANLRGFESGLRAARDGSDVERGPQIGNRTQLVAQQDRFCHRVEQEIPAGARETVTIGLDRARSYQDADYAQLYLDRILQVAKAAAGSDGGESVVNETARQLALRMTYEDVIRVAELKINRARIDAIRTDRAGAVGEPVVIYDYLKPGIEEIASVLPPWIGRALIRAAAKAGWIDRLHLPMQMKTTSLWGYLLFWFLVRLKPFRRSSLRYREENEAIEKWLSHIVAALPVSSVLALEVAKSATLIKGYGETQRRGMANFRTIEAAIIKPALAGIMPVSLAADAMMNARIAALADPDGDRLVRCIADIHQAANQGLPAK